MQLRWRNAVMYGGKYFQNCAWKAFNAVKYKGESLRLLINKSETGGRDLGEPAVYGNIAKGTTELDEAVRKARVLAADDISMSEEFEEDWKALLKDAASYFSAALFDRQAVKLVLDQVNVYNPRDHFQRHHDTPRDGVFGTAVLTTTYERIGRFFMEKHGALKLSELKRLKKEVLASDEEEFSVDSGFVAFYGNTPHEVTPSAYHRVSFVFKIMRDLSSSVGPSWRSIEREIVERYLNRAERLNTYPDPASFVKKYIDPCMQTNKKLGFLLQERYSPRALGIWRKADVPLGLIIDYIQQNALYQVELVGVQIIATQDEDTICDEEDNELPPKMIVKRLSKEDYDAAYDECVEKVFKEERNKDGVPSNAWERMHVWKDVKPRYKSPMHIPFLTAERLNPDYEQVKPSVEWAGNCSEPYQFHAMYYSTAVILSVIEE